MQVYELQAISDKAIEKLPANGKDSQVGIYWGKRKGGRKDLNLVKTGPHVDISRAKKVYVLKRIIRKTGNVVQQRFYELEDVIVYNRVNTALYHRLLMRYSRVKLNDTAALGLPAEEAMINDRDIAKILERSRGDLLCYFGKNEY